MIQWGFLGSCSDASSSGADQSVDGGEHMPTFTTGVQGLLRTKMEAGKCANLVSKRGPMGYGNVVEIGQSRIVLQLVCLPSSS